MVKIAGEWDYYRRRVYGKSSQNNLVAHCGLLSYFLRRTSGEKTIADYHTSTATKDGKDPKEKLIRAAVFVCYSKAWWSPLSLQRYGDSTYSGKYFFQRLFLPSNLQTLSILTGSATGLTSVHPSPIGVEAELNSIRKI